MRIGAGQYHLMGIHALYVAAGQSTVQNLEAAGIRVGVSLLAAIIGITALRATGGDSGCALGLALLGVLGIITGIILFFVVESRHNTGMPFSPIVIRSSHGFLKSVFMKPALRLL
jgi:hypothetical protein